MMRSKRNITYALHASYDNRGVPLTHRKSLVSYWRRKVTDRNLMSLVKNRLHIGSTLNGRKKRTSGYKHVIISSLKPAAETT